MDITKVIKKGQPKSAPRIFMIGEEKIGKSSFANDSPSPIFLCGENGLVGPQFVNTANYTPSSWADVKDFIKSLTDAPGTYKTIVIDTIDWLEPMLCSFVCAKYGETSIDGVAKGSAFGFGKGANAVAEEYRLFLASLERANKVGYGVVILAHSQVKQFNNPTGENFDRYEPKCMRQIAALTKEWSDAVLFAHSKVYTVKSEGQKKSKGIGDGVRVINTNKTPAWDAGNRYGMPDELPLSWQSVIEAIDSGKPDSPEQIEAEISEAIDKSQMTTERKDSAKAALARDKGNVNALKLLLNKIRQAA